MKTIEERADTIADRYVDELHQKIARSSAIESATEQKAIDIEKACGLLHEVLTHFFRRGTPLEELKHNEEVFRKRMMKD